MSEQFVNRHGVRQSVDDAVAQIEHEQGTAAQVAIHEPAPLAPVKPATRRFSLTVPRLHMSKKVWIPLVIVVLAVAFGLVVLGDTARRDYERQNSAYFSSVAILQSKTISAQTNGVDAANNLLESLDKPASCTTGIPAWLAGLYPPAATAHAQCDKTAKEYRTLRSAINDMKAYAAYLASVSDALGNALQAPADGAFAEIAASANSWGTALETLRAVTAPSAMDEAHSTLLTRTQAVSDAWQTLATANEVRDTTAFVDAESKLAAAYQALRLSGTELDTIVTAQQKTIDTALAALEQS